MQLDKSKLSKISSKNKNNNFCFHSISTEFTVSLKPLIMGAYVEVIALNPLPIDTSNPSSPAYSSFVSQFRPPPRLRHLMSFAP